MSDQQETFEEPVKQPRNWRWGKILLTLSLALNLLFVGALVGGGWMRHKYGSGFQGPPGWVVKRLLGHLPADKRQSILDQMSAHRTAMRSKVMAIRARRKELQTTLRREPFEGADVRAAAIELKKSRHEIIDAKTDILVNVLVQLTRDERRQILDSHLFKHLFSRRGRGRHGPHH